MLCDLTISGGKVIDWWRSLNAYIEEGWGRRLVDIDPGRCSGRPTIKGTRFPVSQLLAEMVDGTLEEVCGDFDLNSDDAKDAVEFASQVLAYRAKGFARRKMKL